VPDQATFDTVGPGDGIVGATAIGGATPSDLLTEAYAAVGDAPVPGEPLGKRRRRRGRGVVFRMAAAWLIFVVVMAITAALWPLPAPEDQDLGNRLARPFTEGHILGTDGLGRDVLSRLVWGARVSLIISVAAVSIGTLVGGSIGMAVGYARGRVDGVVMWGMNVLLAFPGLVLLLGLVAFVGQSLTAITLVVGFLSVPTYARVARASTLTVAQREYVLAARALGASKWRILRREILPNVMLPVAAFGMVALGVVIVLEGSLAFLGLSVKAPDPTWGSMIAEGRRHLEETAHLSLIPAAVMFLTVLAVNFVGDAVRGRFDVRESSL
jgi:peptide/nickel transport system permease protein